MPSKFSLLETEIRKGFAFLLRYQFSPGKTTLMPDPRAVAGGVPGSPVDLTCASIIRSTRATRAAVFGVAKPAK